MRKIPHPETIFDRERLAHGIAENLATRDTAPSAEALRDLVLEILAPAYAAGREEIYRRFDAAGKGRVTLRTFAWLMDELVQLLYDIGIRHLLPHGNAGGFCVAAVGGYGRRELFPYSDIDLLFLHADAPAVKKHAQKITEFILYSLWDLQLSVGQSLRTVDDTIARSLTDITIRTNVLDAHFLCGERELYKQFTSRFRQEVVQGRHLEFVRAKLEEREERHRRWGDSRYVLEPNVKEGKGGLRDLQTLYWMARYCYGTARISELGKRDILTASEVRTFRKAAEFFSILRIHLHRLSGRAEERLTFDMQRAIAGEMGYREQGPNRAVERFMKRYFMMTREVGNLTRTFCTALEAEKQYRARGFLHSLFGRTHLLDGFVLEGTRLDFPEGHAIKEDPLSILRLFHTAQRHGTDIHPHALQKVSRNLSLIDTVFRSNEEANRLFSEMLLADARVALTMRRLSDAGVLGKFLPDFGRVTGQMQFDMYHIYSVDEHILTALGILQDIEQGRLRTELPLASEIVGNITQRRALYLGLLCHDIAKGRGGNHAEKGTVIAQKLARRFGFSTQEQTLVGWLVTHHQLLSDIAFKRDINAPETISALAELLKTPERLRLLLLITVSDIRAVGPGIWNGWKGALLRDLYYRVEAYMGAREPDAPLESQEAIRNHLRLQAGTGSWKDEDIEHYLSLGAPAYWGMLDPETHARLAPAILDLEAQGDLNGFAMLHSMDEFRSITELLLCLHDRHGLFSLMTGVLAVCGANIQHAKIFTLKNGVAVERFGLQDWQGKAFEMRQQEPRLRQTIHEVLCGQLDLEQELARVRRTYARRLDPFAFAPSIVINNDISNTHTVIEVTAMDTPGLLHDISRVLREQGLSIATAHITTYGEQAVDVFYVKDMYGMKLFHKSRIREVRHALRNALSETHSEGTT